ncbi:40169_t:CDS:2, partial [Gigaspora margarita]
MKKSREPEVKKKLETIIKKAPIRKATGPQEQYLEAKNEENFYETNHEKT